MHSNFKSALASMMRSKSPAIDTFGSESKESASFAGLVAVSSTKYRKVWADSNGNFDFTKNC